MSATATDVAGGFDPPPAAAEMDAPPAGAMFPCPECGESFKNKLTLGRHRFQHHGIPGASRNKKAKGSKSKTPRKTPSRNTGGPPSQAVLLKEARGALVEALETGGGLLMGPLPIPGTYCVKTSDEFADAVIRIAAKNERILKWLVQSGTAMDYVALGTWTFGLYLAFAVQTGKLAPDAPIAQKRGITAIFDEFYTRIPAEPAMIVEGRDDDESPVADGDLGPAGGISRSAIPVPDILG